MIVFEETVLKTTTIKPGWEDFVCLLLTHLEFWNRKKKMTSNMMNENL